MEALSPPAVGSADALDPRLAQLLDEGFEEVEGCVVLRRFAESARRTSVARCGDETGLEAFVNHVHVDDWLPGVAGREALVQAVAFVSRLASELEGAYPGEAFAAVVAVSDSCTARFHRVRPGQAWLASDLEGYDEAVMEIALTGG